MIFKVFAFWYVELIVTISIHTENLMSDRRVSPKAYLPIPTKSSYFTHLTTGISEYSL